MSGELERAIARAEYADETHRMALELWDYVFPPWRIFEWRRRAKVMRAQLHMPEVQRHPSR